MRHLHLFIALFFCLIVSSCQNEQSYRLNMDSMNSFGAKHQQGWQAAADIHEQQFTENPKNLDAYLGYGESYIINHIFGYIPRNESVPQAREAYNKVIELDPSDPGVLKLGAILSFLDWDWKRAEEQFLASIKVRPEDMNTRHWYSLYLAAMSRMDEAFEQHRIIEEMDVNGDYMIGRGSMYYFVEEYEILRDLMIETIAKDTTVAWGYDWLGMAYIGLDDYENSLNTYFKAFDLSDGTVEVGGGLGHALGQAGEYKLAKELADFYEEAAKTRYLPYCQRSFIHIGIKEYNKALDLLEQAYIEKSWFLIFMDIEPWYEPLRGTERFDALVAKMNYPT